MSTQPTKTVSKAAGEKTRRFTKKTMGALELSKQITVPSDITGTSEEEKGLIFDEKESADSTIQTPTKAPKATKRKKSSPKGVSAKQSVNSPVKRQKLRDASNIIEEKEIPVKVPLKELKPLKTKRNSNKSQKSDSADCKDVPTASTLQKEHLESSITNVELNSPKKGKRRNLKNPYLKIMNQLPQEIKEKLDWSKENLNDICKSLTMPKEDKPGLVLKWIRKVSENEFTKIHEEVLNIKINERKLKRSLYISYDEMHARRVSMNSQRSESSSKVDSDRFTAVKSRDTPNPIINYNVALLEGNSACSKTSSNTKPSPNLVRIPVGIEQPIVSRTSNGYKSGALTSINFKSPIVESIIPGKSIVVKFEAQKPATEPI